MTAAGQGQNLYVGPSASSMAAVVEAWHEETLDYTYSDSGGTCSLDCGHYTQVHVYCIEMPQLFQGFEFGCSFQLVWAKTALIGCGKAVCASISPFGSAGTVLVCSYKDA